MGASLAVGLELCRAAGGEGSAQTAGQSAAQEIVPYPRAVVKSERLAGWTFQTDAAGWRAAHDCVIDNAGGVLRIQSSGDDPYLIGPPVEMDGAVTARLRLKCAAGGNGQIFWMEGTMEGFDEAHSAHFHLWHDNQWHDYRVALAAQGRIRRLRLDPAEGPGVIEVEWLEAVRETLHPLEIESVHSDGARVSARLKNYGAETISFTMGGQTFALEAGATGEFFQIAPGDAPFRVFDLDVAPAGLPAIHRVVSIIDLGAAADWAELRSGDLKVRAARDGSGARVELDGRLVAVLAPLVRREGVTPKLTLTVQGNALLWRGEGVALKLSLRGEEIAAKIESDRACEGPVLRAARAAGTGIVRGLGISGQGRTFFVHVGHRNRGARAVRPGAGEGDDAVDGVRDRSGDGGDDLAGHEVAAGVRDAQFFGRTGRASRLAAGNEHRMQRSWCGQPGRWRRRFFGRRSGGVCRPCRRRRGGGRRSLNYV